MHAVVDVAEAMGAPAIVLVGHPSYYPRFGFEPARPLGLEYPHQVRDDFWMVRRLASWTDELRGRVSFPPAWDGVV
jgi:putative acetyltransferase